MQSYWFSLQDKLYIFFFTIVFSLSLTSVPSGKQHYFHGSIFTDRSCPYSFYLSLLIYFFLFFSWKKETFISAI